MKHLSTRVVLAILTLVVATVAFGHGPTREKYSESIEIAATPETVWALVGDYAHPEKWMNAVESTVAPTTLDKGAVRELKIKGATATIKEELKNLDAEKKTIQYKIVDPTEASVAPVNNYSARITVESAGTGAKVEWDAAFYRWFLNNNPPDGENEAAAKAFVEKIVHESLASLKATAEKK